MDPLDKCSILFIRLCEFLEKLQSQKGKQKSQSLQSFFANSKVANFFPIIRLMVPNFDAERGQYGLKETTLGKIYSELLSLPSREKEALIHYKNPKKQIENCPAGGFVEVLEFLLSKRIGESKHLKIEEVNKRLDELANAIDKAEKKQVICGLLCAMNSLEQKWLVKIILKDMKIGAHDKILASFNPRALEIFSNTNNLREVFAKLSDKNIDLGTQLYTLGQPIRPMLAGRKLYPELKKLLANTEVYVETKFDGERIQLHYTSTGEFYFYTRNANNYTQLYEKSFRSILHDHLINLNACILDGEMIVWDVENNCAARFGQNRTVAISETPGKYLCYKIFDILYLETKDGMRKDLMQVPLSERKLLLEKHVLSIENKFEVVKFFQVKGSKSVFEIFNKAIEENEEGLIVKRVDSPYIPDDRSNLWIKLKSDYFEALSDSLDLLVVGGYFGSGFRAGGEDEFDHITVFLCAVASKIDLKDPYKSKFVPITKVGTGYSLAELGEIRRKLKDNWKPFRNSPEYWPKWSPGPGERPDYFIKDPSKSIVLEVKASEIVPSEKFPTAFTLRFPKVFKVRYDKNWDQTTTFTEVTSIMESFSRGLTEKTAKIEHKPDKNATVKKRKKDNVIKGEVLPAFRDTNTEGVVKKSNLFQGLEFWVIKASEKQELERILVENGGNKVQNLLSTTTHVIADDIRSIRVQHFIEKKDLDVVSPNWIYECIKSRSLVSLRPKHLAHASAKTQEIFDKDFTKHGDSLSLKFQSTEEVLEILKEVSEDETKLMIKCLKNQPQWANWLPDQVKEEIKDIRTYRLLGDLIYVHGQGMLKELVELQVLSRHGEVAKALDQQVRFIVTLDSHKQFNLNIPVLSLDQFYELIR